MKNESMHKQQKLSKMIFLHKKLITASVNKKLFSMHEGDSSGGGGKLS